MPIRRILLIAALAASAPWTAGQTVYRCGSSYGSQPCAGGSVIEGMAGPSSADAAHAGKVTQQDEKRAEAMEKARLAQEKNAPKAIVMGPKEPAPKPEAKDEKKKKKAKGKAQDPEVYTAKAPAEPKKAKTK